MAKYCTKRLPSTTDVLAIHNGKIVFRRFTNSQLPGLVFVSWLIKHPSCRLIQIYHIMNLFSIISGLKGDPKPNLSVMQVPTSKECQSEFGDSEAESEISTSKVVQNSIDEDLKDEVFNHACKSNQLSLRSTSLYAGDRSEQRQLGWPLLRRASSSSPRAPHGRNMSVVQWVMSLPDRSPQLSPQCSTIEESPFEGDINDILDESTETGVSALFELPKGLEHLLKTDSSVCKWFSHEVLKTSTSHFSSGDYLSSSDYSLKCLFHFVEICNKMENSEKKRENGTK